MKNRRNYYRILQVQPDAPIEIIKASYRTQMRELKLHPDLGGSSFDAAVLNEAYEVLSNPERRAAYDKALFLKFTQGGRLRTNSQKPAVPVLCPFCKKALTRNPEPGEICTTCQTPLQSANAGNSPAPGKRSLSRTMISDPIQYYTNWPGAAKQGTMVDLSPEGIRFICGEKLLPKTVLKIRSSLFEASGAVTNSQEMTVGNRKQYAIGVSFLAVNFVELKGTFISTSA
jgi:curved DNA-binding protein CbpA